MHAILDKSALQRICSLPEAEMIQFWAELTKRYRIIFPFILAEEVLTNFGTDSPPSSDVKKMFGCLIGNSDYILNDVFEIAFQELINGVQLSVLPKAPSNFLNFIFGEGASRSEIRGWVQNRKETNKRIIEGWRAAQKSVEGLHELGRVLTVAELTNITTDFLDQVIAHSEKKTRFSNSSLALISMNDIQTTFKSSTTLLLD